MESELRWFIASPTSILSFCSQYVDEDVISQLPAPATKPSEPTTVMDSSPLDLYAKINYFNTAKAK